MRRKRSRSPIDDGSSDPKSRRREGMDEQHYSFQFRDGQLVEFRGDAGAAMDIGLICDLDALQRLIQQDFPVGHVTITLDQAAIRNAGLTPAAPSDRPSSALSSPGSLPPTTEWGMEELLICQPVAATLLDALPFSDWMKLRGVSRCWRNAVDVQLRSFKELDVCARFGHQGEEQTDDEKKKAKSLMEFMAEKAPAIQSLVIGNWVNLFPEVLCRFEKVKLLDMEGAKLKPKLFQVLEELPGLGSLETISFPSEPRIDCVGTLEDHLGVLIGRLSSVKSLTISPFSTYPNMLQALKKPDNLTSLFIKSTQILPMLTPPESIHWAQLTQLRCLELGGVSAERLMNCINQITTLNCLKITSWGKFSCSLPQLHTLCIGSSRFGSIQFDLQPACSNLENLTLLTSHYRLSYIAIAPGLLKHNPGIRNLRIGWPNTYTQALLVKAKSIAKACQSLETLELSHVPSVKDLKQVAALFVDGCPMLQNLKTTREDHIQALKAMEKFGHLNISVCSSNKDLWLFQ